MSSDSESDFAIFMKALHFNSLPTGNIESEKRRNEQESEPVEVKHVISISVHM